jgi:hypothetical protein
MNLLREKTWWALYTRLRSEKKAAQTLSILGTDSCCPTQGVRTRRYDGYKNNIITLYGEKR